MAFPAVLVLAAAVGCGKRPRAAHLFLITIDTCRADRVSCYGYQRPLTPSIDRIAARGVRFARAVAPIPCTLPSHSSLFTGLYPLTLGLTNNFFPLREDVETLAETLAARGYRTGAFFQRFQFHKAKAVQGFEHVFYDVTEKPEVMMRDLSAWLDETARDRHTFIWLHLYYPHAPVAPPEPERRRWVRHPYSGALDQKPKTLEAIRRGLIHPEPAFVDYYNDCYDAEVAYADRVVGEVLGTLRERKLLDDTLLILAADHGESLEKGVIGLHSPVIREATLHVPLLISGPGVPEGRTVEEVVELVDVNPTVLDYLGIPRGEACQGRSLLPLLKGDLANWDERAFSMLPTYFMGRREQGDPPAIAVRTRRWKLVVRGENEPELYDLEQDPGEDRNVSAANRKLVKSLHGWLDDWLHETRSPGKSTAPLDESAQKFLRGLGYTGGGR